MASCNPTGLSSSPEVLSVTARARRSLPPRGGGGPATGRRGDQAVQPPTSSAQWLGLIRPPHPTSPARGRGTLSRPVSPAVNAGLRIVTDRTSGNLLSRPLKSDSGRRDGCRATFRGRQGRLVGDGDAGREAGRVVMGVRGWSSWVVGESDRHR